MAGVVDEPAVFLLLDGRPGADLFQKTREHRATAARLDDDVAEHDLAAVGVHTNHVRDAVAHRIAGDQADNHDAAPHRHMLGGLHNSGDRRLHQGPSRGQRVEPRVPVAETAREQRVQITERIQTKRSRVDQRTHDVRSVVRQQLAKARLKDVQHVELVHASPFPAGPRCVRLGWRSGVALEHRDLVTIEAEQERSTQTDDTATDHDDAGHESPFPQPEPYLGLGRSSYLRRSSRQESADVSFCGRCK